MIPKQHDEHADSSNEQEFRRRLEDWAKTSGVEAKEWKVRQFAARWKISASRATAGRGDDCRHYSGASDTARAKRHEQQETSFEP